MAKNVLIFSDGTGQAGGLIPDELRSNIYKLYRATRCGTDTNIGGAVLYATGIIGSKNSVTIQLPKVK